MLHMIEKINIAFDIEPSKIPLASFDITVIKTKVAIASLIDIVKSSLSKNAFGEKITL